MQYSNPDRHLSAAVKQKDLPVKNNGEMYILVNLFEFRMWKARKEVMVGRPFQPLFLQMFCVWDK